MFSKYLKYCLAALIVFNVSAEETESIELEPGLWSSTHTLSVEGVGIVDEDTHQVCISESEANPAVSSLLADVLEGNCEMTDFMHTPGEASMNAICLIPEDQVRIEGKIKVTYSRTAYTVNAEAVINGPGGSSTSSVVTQTTRIGDCE